MGRHGRRQLESRIARREEQIKEGWARARRLRAKGDPTSISKADAQERWCSTEGAFLSNDRAALAALDREENS